MKRQGERGEGGDGADEDDNEDEDEEEEEEEDDDDDGLIATAVSVVSSSRRDGPLFPPSLSIDRPQRCPLRRGDGARRRLRGQDRCPGWSAAFVVSEFPRRFADDLVTGCITYRDNGYLSTYTSVSFNLSDTTDHLSLLISFYFSPFIRLYYLKRFVTQKGK